MADLIFIDHYDSFSLNLVDWLSSSSPNVNIEFIHFDNPCLLNLLLDQPKPLVFSPGPKSPHDAFKSGEIMRQFIGKVPILGVCLGHQMLGSIVGFDVDRSRKILHGKTEKVLREPNSLLLAQMPSEFYAARYNSLTLRQSNTELSHFVKARNSEGEIMAIEFQLGFGWPAFGLQFHPESFLMIEESRAILSSWQVWVNAFNSKQSLFISDLGSSRFGNRA